MTIDRWIAAHARFQPNKPALWFAGKPTSYRQLNAQIDLTARVLQRTLSIDRGDSIFYLGLNHPDFLVLLFAAARQGIVIAPLKSSWSESELEWAVAGNGQLEQSRWLFYDSHHEHQARRLGQKFPDLAVLPLHSAHGLRDLCGRQSAKLIGNRSLPEPAMSAPWLLMFTSGRTARPKGVTVSQQAMQWRVLMSLHMQNMTTADNVLSVLPLSDFVALGLQVLPALYIGASVTLLPRVNSDKIIAGLHRGDVSLFAADAAVLDPVLDYAGSSPKKLSGLRAVAAGGCEIPLATLRELARLNIPFLPFYGSTETGACVVYQQFEQAPVPMGSIGRYGLHTQLKLVNEAGFEPDPNEPGEIWIKGQHLFSSYWQDPQATNENVANGWFRSGDAASQDESGNLWFAGRLQHAVVSGGQTVYVAEVERILRDIASVADAAVAGHPDEEWGELVVALVVRLDRSLSEDKLMGLLGQQLAPIKRPRKILFVAGIPRDSRGEICFKQVANTIRQLVAEETEA